MSLQRLWNHTVRLYREAEPDEWGHGSGAVEPVGPAPTQLNARPDQNWSGTLQDGGAGEQQAGKRRWFVSREVEVLERDVLQVTQGPEAGIALRVLSSVPVTTPRGVHHREVNVEVFVGELLT